MELYFRRYGKEGDPPLVILHGLFGLSDNWDTLARRYAEEGMDVIVPDQRNHGRSGHSPVHTYEAMTDDLLELLDRLALEATTLLGHSMGGKTAMQFAFDHPERVDRLIVADIAPSASGTNTRHQQLIDIMTKLPLEDFSSRSEADEALAGRIPARRVRQFLTKNIYWKDKSSLGWRINLDVLRDSLDEVFRGVGGPGTFDKPVLFLRGGQSDYVPDSAIPSIKKLFPRARLETVSGGTHWLHADNPEDFFSLSMDFLSDEKKSLHLPGQ
jgi:pimeloyl-ACP methyl ester carboxylesterase